MVISTLLLLGLLLLFANCMFSFCLLFRFFLFQFSGSRWCDNDGVTARACPKLVRRSFRSNSSNQQHEVNNNTNVLRLAAAASPAFAGGGRRRKEEMPVTATCDERRFFRNFGSRWETWIVNEFGNALGVQNDATIKPKKPRLWLFGNHLTLPTKFSEEDLKSKGGQR